MTDNEKSIYYDSSSYKVLKGIQHQTTDLYLCNCGIQQCESGHFYEAHPRDEYLIHIVLEGQGTFRLGDKNYSLEKGQFFYIPPLEADYRYQADLAKPWQYAWIGFQGRMAGTYLSYLGLSAANPVCLQKEGVPVDTILHFIQELLKAKTLSLPNEITRIGYLYKLLGCLTNFYQSTLSQGKAHEYPSKTYALYAKDYIENHYADSSVLDIADFIGINRSYLHSIFKQTFDMSPQEYLISYRLHMASLLLIETNLPVKQIARQVGYEDPMQFSKIFKKHLGESPKYYRQSGRRRQIERNDPLF